MSSEIIKDGTEEFKQKTLDQILTAYLDTENPVREITIKAAKASLKKKDAVLADAVGDFLRIQDIEDGLNDCLLDARSATDQEIRDLSNERGKIKAKIIGNPVFARNFKLVEGRFAAKLAEKEKNKVKS